MLCAGLYATRALLGETALNTDREQNIKEYAQNHLLQPGEQVVWTGCASPTSAAKLGVGGILYGLFAMVFAAIWEFRTSGPEASGNVVNVQLLHMTWTATGVGFVDLLLIFVLSVSGFWLFVRPVRYYLRATRTVYVVTDRHIFLVSDCWWRRVVRVSPSDIRDYKRTDFGNGNGDIQLRRTGLPGHWKSRLVRFHDGFWGIRDVGGADEAITAIMLP